LKAEFINKSIAKRKNFFNTLCLAVIILLIISLYKYFFPPDYKHHHYGLRVRHSLFELFGLLNYTQFLLISVLTALIGIPLIFYRKIIHRITVDTKHDLFEVEYVGRFSLSSVTKTAKLSEINVQIERPEHSHPYAKDRGYFSIHLRHKHFGYLKVSAHDFKNIKQICDQFQSLKAGTNQGRENTFV
jgi:hypothetical protein